MRNKHPRDRKETHWTTSETNEEQQRQRQIRQNTEQRTDNKHKYN